MVEAFAVASGKGGTGKTTATLALGMALAEEHDVTIVDADTGMANLLFHAGLEDVETTLHDLLIEEREASVDAAVYERHGLSVVPCGTSLTDFEAAEPGRLRDVVASLAADTDILLLDSPAALGSKTAVLPIVLADRVITVLSPTIPALSDGLKVQEYASSYGTDTAGVLFNKVRDDVRMDTVTDRTERYFDGPVIGAVPECSAAHRARAAGEPLLSYAPESPAASAFVDAAAELTIEPRDSAAVASRFRSAVLPDRP